MGKLLPGAILSFEETRDWSGRIKEIGVQQFLTLHRQHSARQADPLLWGDEIEYMVVRLDRDARRARLALRAAQLLPLLQTPMPTHELGAIWLPEYADYMVEGTPGQPYAESLAQWTRVEPNMKARRQDAQALLQPQERILTITHFPRMGCPGFTWPEVEPNPERNVFGSSLVPEEGLYRAHERFLLSSRNCRARRGRKMEVQIPVFKDTQTPSPFVDPSIPEQEADMIYMDGLGFGLSCLQMTFQTRNIEDAMRLYDQLASVCPVMMALTAATPFFRGYLSDLDVRWKVIMSGLDDRTEEELETIPKSRCSSISAYLCAENAPLNDVRLVYEETHFQTLVAGGVEAGLAQHVALLFQRDPLFLYAERLEQDPEKETGHFDNLQATNWLTLRFKPPPLKSASIGWRVEFRPCEVQLTDFQNAAVAVFIALLTRLILHTHLKLTIPISKIDESFEKAQMRNAVREQKLWFRTDSAETGDFGLLSVDEIVNGGQKFSGLVPLIRNYLDSLQLDPDTTEALDKYIQFISKRASGEVETNACWLRDAVAAHPDYKQDSVVSEEINYELMYRVGKMAQE